MPFRFWTGGFQKLVFGATAVTIAFQANLAEAAESLNLMCPNLLIKPMSSSSRPKLRLIRSENNERFLLDDSSPTVAELRAWKPASEYVFKDHAFPKRPEEILRTLQMLNTSPSLPTISLSEMNIIPRI